MKNQDFLNKIDKFEAKKFPSALITINSLSALFKLKLFNAIQSGKTDVIRMINDPLFWKLGGVVKGETYIYFRFVNSKTGEEIRINHESIMRTSSGEIVNLCDSPAGTGMRDLNYLLSQYDIMEMIDPKKIHNLQVNIWINSDDKAKLTTDFNFARLQVESQIQKIKEYSRIFIVGSIMSSTQFVNLRGDIYRTLEQQTIRDTIIIKWYIHENNEGDFKPEEMKRLRKEAVTYIQKLNQAGMQDLQIPIEIATSEFFIANYLNYLEEDRIYLKQDDIKTIQKIQYIRRSTTNLETLLASSCNKEKVWKRMDQYSFMIQAIMYAGTVEESGFSPARLSASRFKQSLDEYLSPDGSIQDSFTHLRKILQSVATLVDCGFESKEKGENGHYYPILSQLFNFKKLNYEVELGVSLLRWLHQTTLTTADIRVGYKQNWRYIAENFIGVWKSKSGIKTSLIEEQRQTIQKYFLQTDNLLDGFHDLIQLSGTQLSYVQSMARAFEMLGSLLMLGESPNHGFHSNINSNYFHHHPTDIGRWIKDLYSLVDRNPLFVSFKRPSEVFERYAQLEGLLSAFPNIRKTLSLKEIIEFELLIQYFTNTLFQGSESRINTFLNKAYLSFYDQVESLTEFEAQYIPLSKFIIELSPPSNSFSINIHGCNVLIKNPTLFEKEVIQMFSDSEIFEDLIPPHIFRKFLYNNSIKDVFGKEIELVIRLDNHHKSIGDIALKFPKRQVLYVECLGFGVLTRPYLFEKFESQDPKEKLKNYFWFVREIYGPEKDDVCFERIFRKNGGEPSLYIAYNTAIYNYYQNTAPIAGNFQNLNNLRNIGRIAPVLSKKQLKKLLEVWTNHSEEYPTLDAILANLGKLESELVIEDVSAIQLAFGLKSGVSYIIPLDSNWRIPLKYIYSTTIFSSNKVNFLPWWQNFWASTDMDSYSWLKYNQLLSLREKE